MSFVFCLNCYIIVITIYSMHAECCFDMQPLFNNCIIFNLLGISYIIMSVNQLQGYNVVIYNIFNFVILKHALLDSVIFFKMNFQQRHASLP